MSPGSLVRLHPRWTFRYAKLSLNTDGPQYVYELEEPLNGFEREIKGDWFKKRIYVVIIKVMGQWMVEEKSGKRFINHALMLFGPEGICWTWEDGCEIIDVLNLRDLE